MNIVVEGGERFRLLELTTRPRRSRPGVVEPVVDDDEPADDADVDACARGLHASSPRSPRATSTSRSPTRRSSTSSSPRASTSASTRSRSCSRRPRRAHADARGWSSCSRASLEAVRLEQTLRERAAGNGKVSPLDRRTLAVRHRRRRRAPPRRASPAAASVAVRAAPRRRSCRRRRGCGAASGRRRSPIASSRSSSAASKPPSQWTCGSSTCTRGASIASATPRPCATTFDDHLHDRAAQPHRARAADDEPRAVGADDDRRRHHARQPATRRRPAPPATRSYSPSMLFSWMPVPGTITPEPEPVDDESDAAFPSRVDDGDVRRAAGGRVLRRARQRRRDARDGAPRAARPTSSRCASPPRCSRAANASSRARVCSRITSASDAIASARARPAARRRARAARARRRSGCRPTTAAGSRSPRGRGSARAPGRRQTTRYAARSSRRQRPAARARRSRRSRAASSPRVERRRRLPSAIRSSVPPRSGSRSTSPGCRRAPSARL